MNIVEFGQVGFHQLKIPLFRFWSSHSVPLFAASILDMWRFNPLFSQSRVAFLLVEYMFAGWFPHVCLWNPQFCWWNLSLFLLVNIPVLFAKTWVCLRGPPKEKQVFSTDATNGKLILAKCTQQTCSANSRKSIMFLLKLPFGGKYTHSQTPKIPYHWVIYISDQISLFSQLNHHYWWLNHHLSILCFTMFSTCLLLKSLASNTETSLLEVVGAHSSLWHFLLRQNNSGLTQQNLGFCHLSVVDSKQ